MFTGIIEEVGQIAQIARSPQGARLTISAKTVLSDAKIGDSIAVNGVCLTVCARTEHSFTADVMAQTLRMSALGSLSVGSAVNLERAMAADGRFGGHIVSGHIDGTGILTARKTEDIAVWHTISAAPALLYGMVEKGSIAIDGISLTIARLTDSDFSVSIIPHTGAQTTLLGLKIGAVVNLECDMVGKYLRKYANTAPPAEKQGLSQAFLQEHGF